MLEIVKDFTRDFARDFINHVLPTQSGEVKGRYYTRTGSCNLCGKCCKDIYLIHNEKTIETIAEFEALQPEDPEYQHFIPMRETEHGVQFQCKHLQPDNRCGIYNDRPSFCRKYPSEKSLLLGGQLAEGCGYRFELINTFQSVLSEAARKKEIQAGKLLT